jgi:hypothetical protein
VAVTSPRLIGALRGAVGGVPGPGQAERRDRQEDERLKGEQQIAADLTVGDVEPAAARRQPETLRPATNRGGERHKRATVQGGGPAADRLGEHQSPACRGRGRT